MKLEFFERFLENSSNIKLL